MSGRSTRTAQVRVGFCFTGALQDLVVSDPLILEAPAPTQVDLRPCSIPKCQKMSREANSHKRDNFLDVAGFAANADECG